MSIGRVKSVETYFHECCSKEPYTMGHISYEIYRGYETEVFKQGEGGLFSPTIHVVRIVPMGIKFI